MAMRFSTKQYFIKETYKSIRRNGFMSFASISTVAVSLLVLGMFLMIFLNTNNLAQYLENQVWNCPLFINRFIILTYESHV